MRREIEARFEEKLKLKILEVERLSAEVSRLKQVALVRVCARARARVCVCV